MQLELGVGVYVGSLVPNRVTVGVPDDEEVGVAVCVPVQEIELLEVCVEVSVAVTVMS